MALGGQPALQSPLWALTCAELLPGTFQALCHPLQSPGGSHLLSGITVEAGDQAYPTVVITVPREVNNPFTEGMGHTLFQERMSPYAGSLKSHMPLCGQGPTLA